MQIPVFCSLAVLGAVLSASQLQGQAPYLFNAGLFYSHGGTQFSFTYNQTGPRIYAASVGHKAHQQLGGYYLDPGSLGSLIELTRRQFDLSFSQHIASHLTAKVTVQNLLNNVIQIAEDANFTYKYEKPVYQRPPAGSQIGLSYQNGSDQLLGSSFDRVAGDLLAVNYRPGRSFLLTITYSF